MTIYIIIGLLTIALVIKKSRNIIVEALVCLSLIPIFLLTGLAILTILMLAFFDSKGKNFID
ncbi:MAG: hypothetical protein Q7R33_00850 [Nitrosarchaeum sp.]|nr:hypothetical protein [Nitrosarchaeum sp.]